MLCCVCGAPVRVIVCCGKRRKQNGGGEGVLKTDDPFDLVLEWGLVISTLLRVLN